LLPTPLFYCGTCVQRKGEEIMVAENRLKAKSNEQHRMSISQSQSLRRSATMSSGVAVAVGVWVCACMNLLMISHMLCSSYFICLLMLLAQERQAFVETVNKLSWFVYVYTSPMECSVASFCHPLR